MIEKYKDSTGSLNNLKGDIEEMKSFIEKQHKSHEELVWEARRYEIAKELMAAFLSNSNSNVHGGTPKSQAQDAVEYADALIEELKKGGLK